MFDVGIPEGLPPPIAHSPRTRVPGVGRVCVYFVGTFPPRICERGAETRTNDDWSLPRTCLFDKRSWKGYQTVWMWFTKSCDLSRQAERCTDGPAKIICPWNKVWAPKYFYERAFHPRVKYGRAACYLFEAESKRSGIHIHYQLCGHGGKRLIAGHPVDGYHHEKSNSLSVP